MGGVSHSCRSLTSCDDLTSHQSRPTSRPSNGKMENVFQRKRSKEDLNENMKGKRKDSADPEATPERPARGPFGSCGALAVKYSWFLIPLLIGGAVVFLLQPTYLPDPVSDCSGHDGSVFLGDR